ncbi:MAG: monomethylamine:corrinoid methyltransferase [Chloroflexota bacterium]|nr:monomethylamine:corrinoid methyltransferase [Chloroflexota bacterium]
MLSLLDIAERMQRGPKVDENAWNMGLFKKMNELTQKYELVYPRDGSFFNMDDALADRAFRAGLDFLTEVGAYCISTGRVVQFSRQEVVEAVRAMPAELRVGEGRDARVLKKRRLGERVALNHCPGHHAPWSEELAPLVVKNYAQIMSGDYLEGFNFAVVDGREIHGMPMEVYAARREAAWMRQGVTKAGRPGLAIAYYPINTRAADMIAPIDREVGFRPSDGVLLSVLPDIKVEQDYLTAAIVWEEYGGFKVNGGGGGAVGGFAGDVGGAIIEGVVKPIVGFIVYRDEVSYAGVHRMRATVPGGKMAFDPAMCWATSVVCQALNRNTDLIYFGGSLGAGDPGSGTETRLWSLVGALAAPINGGNLGVSRQWRAQMDASQNPLEAEWVYEVAVASMRTGLDQGTASELLVKLNARLAGRTAEETVHISQCYDLVHHRPLPRYEETYLKVKGELTAMGLCFD